MSDTIQERLVSMEEFNNSLADEAAQSCVDWADPERRKEALRYIIKQIYERTARTPQPSESTASAKESFEKWKAPRPSRWESFEAGWQARGASEYERGRRDGLEQAATFISELSGASDGIDPELTTSDIHYVIGKIPKLAASHPLQDKPPAAPELSRDNHAWLASTTPRPELIAVSEKVWGVRFGGQMICAPTIEEAVTVLRSGLAAKEQPPAAPRCESFDVEGIMTDYCTLTKGHIGPHWGKHWNWAAQDKPTPGETR